MLRVHWQCRAATLMRVNIWIILEPCSRFWSSLDTCNTGEKTERICADDPTASVCQR